MSHLSRDERLLALDGVLEAQRQAHLAACEACRTEVEGLRAVLARVRAVDVPEPSPLFWDHLAARVGDAIAREPGPAVARGWWAPRLGWAALAVIVTAAAAGYLSRPRAPEAPVVAHVAPAPPDSRPAETGRGELAPPSPDGIAVDVDAPFTDDGWALLAAVAEDAGADETFAPLAGQAELALSSLSAAERTALAAELAAALGPDRVREG
jgi:hypothetical protein